MKFGNMHDEERSGRIDLNHFGFQKRSQLLHTVSSLLSLSDPAAV